MDAAACTSTSATDLRRRLSQLRREQDRRWVAWRLIAALRCALPPRVAHRLFRALVDAGLPRVGLALADLHLALDAAARELRASED